jgi:predicted TIM-barrel fold metal-dependent hydrolase
MAVSRPIIDIDTHCGPRPDVLKQFADERLVSRWGDLQPYLNVRPDADGVPQSILRVNPIPYERPLNTKGTALTVAGPGTLGSLDSKDKALGKTVPRGTGQPSSGVEDVSPEARLADMDKEGVDIHLIIPGTWANASTAIDQDLAIGMYDAYHRFAADFCATDLDRLKTVVLAPATDPNWAGEQIAKWANERWVAGVIPLLPEGVPIDDPDLEPIWQAMEDANLPIVYHSFFYEPPYFPGYRDVWGNLAVARTAAHPWGAQRVLAALVLSGMFDRWPSLRIGFSETGAGWLPYWMLRLGMMTEYLPSAVEDLACAPIDYVAAGRIFAGIQFYEGAATAKAVIDQLGEDCLMYQSDYPHGECEWPDSVKRGLSWEPAIGASAADKLMGRNAERFLRLI